MGLFKTLLFLLLVYLIYKALKLILPIRRYIKEVNAKMRHEEALRGKRMEREGEVTVNYAPEQKKDIGKNEGDYVDFEEIKK
jgi:hypothetical protein